MPSSLQPLKAFLLFSSASFFGTILLAMNIELDPIGKETLEKLLESKEQNIEVSQWLNDYLENHYDAIDESALEEKQKEEGYTKEVAFSACFYELLGFDPDDPEVERLKEENGFCDFKVVDESLMKDNPYGKAIHIKGKPARGRYALSNNYFAPYEGFNLEDTFSSGEASYYKEKNTLGYFSSKVSYPVLTDKDEVWMSLTPHEILTMKKPIEEAKGKVLTFGLGLGYFAFMVSEKEEVSSVTIIEKDNNVIRLFEENLLPMFPHKEKIHIIKEDCFHYFEKKITSENYDFLFVDIYHTAEDGLSTYLRLMREEKEDGPAVSFWIEPSLLCLLRRYVLTLIEENLNGYEEKDYLEPTREEENNLLTLFKAMKGVALKTKEDLFTLLSDDGLRKLARKAI